MRLSFDPEVELTTTLCPTCGIQFGLPPGYLESRRINGGRFMCPNGHSLGFGKSEVEKLREKLQLETSQREFAQKALAAEQTKRAQAEARANHHRDYATRLSADLQTAENRVRGHKAANTRIKNRVANGVCPCCNRTFQNLQRHMKSQHPSFQQEVD